MIGDEFPSATQKELGKPRPSSVGEEQPQLMVQRKDGMDVPLSFAQQRLWFLEQWEPGNSIYNNFRAMRLCGLLKIVTLYESLNILIRRHETLRTTFDDIAGNPAQIIVASHVLDLHMVDLRGIAVPQQETEVLRRCSQEIQHPFDLTQAPPMRAVLLRLQQEEHVILVILHHIISDGWSMNILFRDLFLCYKALMKEEAPVFPDLPIQYADFALWQRRWLQGEVLERQLNYWRQQLRNLPTLDLPTDFPRPSVQTFQGAHYSFAFPSSLCSDLRMLSRRQGATLFMTLLATFAILLKRYTGQEDFAVGSPIANRTHRELEDLIGFFVNTLVLRVDLSGHPTFLDLLARLRRVTLEAYAHQDLPFEALVQALAPERTLRHTPLFQVMFALHNVPRGNIDLTEITLHTLEVESGTAKFDLALNLVEINHSLQGTVEYRTDLFTPTTIERMIGHYRILLESIVARPSLPVAQVPLLTAQERHQLLWEWNNTATIYPKAQGLHTLFEAQVERAPDAIAVVVQEAHLSYGVLNARANQLAAALRRRGVGPDNCIAIYLQRSLELVIALQGILKAGGAYLPLDPTAPRERLRRMLDEVQPALLLSQSQMQPVSLMSSPERLLLLDVEWQIVAQELDHNPGYSICVEQLAYVIYTSGSTGQPKGVMVSHRAICNSLQWMQDAFRLTALDCLVQKTPLIFDASLWEIFWPLNAGARIVLARPEGHRESGYLCDLIAQEQVSVVFFVPSQLQAWLEETGAEQCHSLRQILCGGEALSAELLKYAEQQHPAALSNLYGPTEASIQATCWASTREPGRGTVPIGKGIANTQIYVLDSTDNPVPSGIAGEVYLGGVNLARGYFQQPDLTAERFVPNPFSKEAGARLYRTGDLACYRADGNLEYLGRTDMQVKIRGVRIEPAEIERVLVGYSGVQEAVVMAQSSSSAAPFSEQVLVAYVVAHPSEVPTVTALRSYLQTHLPASMLPSAFVFLETLPLTPNGKLDRRALPLPDLSRPALEEAYTPPRTPREEILAGIWMQVLALREVGVQDNFFALGGDSIRSLRVVALAKARGVSFSLPHLFGHPTIAQLAALLPIEQVNVPLVPSSQPLSLLEAEDRARLPAEVEDAYPLTQLQAGMLFHSDYQAESTLYHNVSSLHIRAAFDAGVLQEAMDLLLARHAVLRTSFDLTSFRVPLQLVHRQVQVPLQLADWRALDAEAQEQALERWMLAEKSHRFTWQQTPLLRVHVHLRSADAFQLSLSEHHALLDGWSVAALLTELLQTYSALLAAAQGSLPSASALLAVSSPRATMRDFVAAEQAILCSPEVHHFWEETLRGAEPFRLPRWPHAHGTPEQQEPSSAAYLLSLALSPELSEGLTRLARQLAVPLKSVLLAAHVRVMSLLGGTRDVLTGLTVHARPETTDGERVLGLFLNSLPYRQRLEGGSWRDLVQQTFQTEQALWPYRQTPLAHLQQQRGGQPLFETLFSFTHFHVYERLEGLSNLEVLERRSLAQTNFPLVVHMSQVPASTQLLLRLEYQPEEVSSEQARAIVGYYQATLEAMSAQLDAEYSWQSLLAPEEAHQVLQAGHGSVIVREQGQTLPTLFEAQVQACPEAIAVVCGEEHLSYGLLNARANQLAHYLRTLGVGPEMLVGISVERSAEMLVGLLAILKAGGAYVPLDPMYPQERLAFMLEDSQISLLLTQQHLQTRLPAHESRTICLDVDWPHVASHPESTLSCDSTGANLAYVIYTSGSTGVPKGVMVSHQGLTNYLCWASDYYQVASGNGSAVHSPLSFDLTVTGLFSPLLVGKRVILLPEDQSIEDLGTILSQGYQLSLVKLTPAHLEALQHWITPSQLEHAADVVVVGGEALLDEHVNWWQTHATSTRFINEYGPTETVVGCCTYVVPGPKSNEGALPIGRPIANTQLYVLDARLQPLPVGLIGELYIGGDGLARGYCRRPELTAERFIPHPFSKEAGSRLYKTGDLARYRPDGMLEFLGRNDTQVKIRGYRIELGEIEAILRQHPDVREAAIVAYEEIAGDKRLIAYIVPQSSQMPTISDLRSFLQAKLPAYMLPSSFVLLERMPLTLNGKVDRHALPPPGQICSEQASPSVPPRNHTEETLMDIWRRVLGSEQISIYDNFFARGGHSLTATQVIAHIREIFQTDLPLRSIFDAPTIADLAVAIVQRRAERVDSDMLALMLMELEQLVESDIQGIGTVPEQKTIGEVSNE